MTSDSIKTYTYLNIISNICSIIEELDYLKKTIIYNETNSLYYDLRFLNIENKLKSLEKIIPTLKYPYFQNEQSYISSIFNYISFLKKNIINIEFNYLYYIHTLIYSIKIELKIL
jgi:hypothetical protein